MEEKKEIRIPTEVYSRVVGYFRPVSQWNQGKKTEFADRKPFVLDLVKLTGEVEKCCGISYVRNREVQNLPNC